MHTTLDILKQHVEYRGQLFKLAKSDLLKTYRGAALGWAWAVVKPAITIFVFWFAFSVGLRHGHSIDGYPFFLWLIAGMGPWFYMKDMIQDGANSIRKNKHLVTKMKFPIATIPTFISISKFAVHLVLMLIIIAIFIGAGHAPDIYYLQLPFYMLCMFLFFTIWGLFAGMLSCISKDFLNLVKSVVQALFWLSGIIYDARTISIVWIKTILLFNPVTYIANGYRNVFIDKIWFWQAGKENLYFLIVLIVMYILAIWAYRKLRKDIPDVL